MAFVILCDRCGKIIKPGNSSYTSVSCTMNGKMDVNEKLVELLDNAIIDSDAIYGFTNTNQVADRLIANGVTVQEWISVDDRLPEQGEEAICIAADGDMMIGKYTEWGWMFPCYFEELTHWMPLPEPPKGE